MTDRRVRYARNGSVRLAYREFGEGDTTLVWNPGWFSNVDLVDEPASPVAAFVEQLAEVTRLIVWDKRGTGLSDPATQVPPLDERMDDLRAVLDAAEADRPALFGMSEGGPMSLLFAATHPERVQSLVMYGAVARFSQELPDYPWGFTAEEKAEHLEAIESHWGEGALGELFFGDFAEIPGFRDFYGRVQRVSASPTMAAWLWQALLEIDVRGILGSIRAPTLVLARPDDRVAPFEGAAALAAAIPGARFKTLPEGPHSILDDVVGSAILDFVCGTTGAAIDERVVKTVLFTDIVGSTELLSAGGDAQCVASSMHMTKSSTGHWKSTAAATRNTPEMGSSRFSTGQPRLPAARWNWSPPSPRVVSGSEQASTPVNASDAARSGAAWPCTPALASAHWQVLVRCWPAGQYGICQQDRA
ncbi:MAG: alpha/beta fold hydrolase [Mycobacterium sp.]